MTEPKKVVGRAWRSYPVNSRPDGSGRQKHVGLHVQDMYSVRSSDGTEYAEQILKLRPAKPPGKS